MRRNLPSFAGGEIGDGLLSRDDTAKFRTALRRARNVVISTSGGVFNRQGTLFAGEVHDSAEIARVVPFQFSVGQGYALELGDQTLRIIANGGYVVRRELLVTDITNGHPATVTATAHGYEDGWDVVFENIEGMTEINGRRARVLSHTDDTFTIDLDTSDYGIFTGSGGGTAGDAAGGTGGDPVPPAPEPPTTPPPPPPPFYDFENPPDIYLGDYNYNIQ